MAAARGAARRCRPVAEGGCGRRSSLARSTRSRARGDRGGRRGVPDDGGHEAQLGRDLDEPSSRSTQAAQSRIDSCSSLRGLVRLASPDPSRSSGRRRRPTTGDACVRRPLWWPSSGVMASAARGARNQTGRPRHDGMVLGPSGGLYLDAFRRLKRCCKAAACAAKTRQEQRRGDGAPDRVLGMEPVGRDLGSAAA